MEWRRLEPKVLKLPDGKSGWEIVLLLRSLDFPGAPKVGKRNVRTDVWLSAYIIRGFKAPFSESVWSSELLVLSQIDIKGENNFFINSLIIMNSMVECLLN